VYNDYNRAYLFDIDFWYIKLYMKKKGRKFRKGEVSCPGSDMIGMTHRP